MKKLLIIGFVMCTLMGYSQKKPLLEKYDEVVKTASLHLDEAMKGPEGELFLFKSENTIVGTYNFDITLHEKGKVATVFVKGNEGGSIKKQNMLKDYIKEMQFNFKMPKGKDYKFNYVFNFTN